MKKSPVTFRLQSTLAIIFFSYPQLTLAQSQGKDVANNITNNIIDRNIGKPMKILDSYFQEVKSIQKNIIMAIEKEIEKLNDSQFRTQLTIEERAIAIRELQSKLTELTGGGLDEVIRDRFASKNSAIEKLHYEVFVIKAESFLDAQIQNISFKANARASSEFNNSYAAANSIDANLGSEWALLGSKGNLSIRIRPTVNVQSVYFISRRFHDDPVFEGEIVINKKIRIPVKNFLTKDVMAIEFSDALDIETIDYEIKSGANNPAA